MNKIYPVQSFKDMAHNPKYVQLVQYIKRVEESIFSRAETKVRTYVAILLDIDNSRV